MSNASAKSHFLYPEGVAYNPGVDRSKRLVFSATRDLERHEAWLKRHHELYSESLQECQRQLERRNVIDACARAILLPITLLVSVCAALYRWAWVLTRRFQMRIELQSRINAMDQLSPRRLPGVPWRAAAGKEIRQEASGRRSPHHSQRVKPREIRRPVSVSG
jgi:hypothetical protein